MVPLNWLNVLNDWENFKCGQIFTDLCSITMIRHYETYLCMIIHETTYNTVENQRKSVIACECFNLKFCYKGLLKLKQE